MFRDVFLILGTFHTLYTTKAEIMCKMNEKCSDRTVIHFSKPTVKLKVPSTDLWLTLAFTSTTDNLALTLRLQNLN